MIKRILEIIKIISGMIGGLAVVVTTVYGGYSFITKNAVKQEQAQAKESAYENKTDQLIMSVDDIKQELYTVSSILSDNNRLVKSLDQSYTRHLQNTKEIEELIDYVRLQKADKTSHAIDSISYNPSVIIQKIK
jgi:hypothetical protein